MRKGAWSLLVQAQESVRSDPFVSFDLQQPTYTSNLLQPKESQPAKLKHPALFDAMDFLAKMPNPRTLIQLPLIGSLLSSIDESLRPTAPSCPNPQLSCDSSNPVVDTCCFNSPAGLFFQTQFWDDEPSIGPNNSWTIHGLWPNYCPGDCHGNPSNECFPETCDSDRQFDHIDEILCAFGADDLVNYMSEYMLPNDNPDPRTFWAHEWGKHGTCVSTLRPECYSDDPDSPPHREVLDYFTIMTTLFRTLDTYAALAEAGIEPSDTETFSLDQLLEPLVAKHGGPVILRCKNKQGQHKLDEVYYPFSVRGALQSGLFVPAAPSDSESNCPEDGILYLPKSGSGEQNRVLIEDFCNRQQNRVLNEDL